MKIRDALLISTLVFAPAFMSGTTSADVFQISASTHVTSVTDGIASFNSYLATQYNIHAHDPFTTMTVGERIDFNDLFEVSMDDDGVEFIQDIYKALPVSTPISHYFGLTGIIYQYAAQTGLTVDTATIYGVDGLGGDDNYGLADNTTLVFSVPAGTLQPNLTPDFRQMFLAGDLTSISLDEVYYEFVAITGDPYGGELELMATSSATIELDNLQQGPPIVPEPPTGIAMVAALGAGIAGSSRATGKRPKRP